jgi:hypothetical protein
MRVVLFACLAYAALVAMAAAIFPREGKYVGWVERSETHYFQFFVQRFLHIHSHSETNSSAKIIITTIRITTWLFSHDKII